MTDRLMGMTRQELESLAVSMGQPKFRGRQIAEWLYKKNASSIEEMTDLPAAFRACLEAETVLYRSAVITQDKSRDGTIKVLLGLEDDQRIEAVLLPYEDRVSVCLSTQVGCPAGCVFCATGIGGLARNLTAGEIVDEVLTLQRLIERRISHIVFMGMGEPLLNYEDLLKSIRILNEEVGIAMRQITVSTVGITPQIARLAEEKLQVTLAISLHAPDDLLRQRLVPISAKYPLRDLLKVCRHYADVTGRRVTFEYMLIDGVNDSVEMAERLAKLLRGMVCNVNLIPYNAVEGLEYRRPSRERVKAFREVLDNAGISVTQRQERGHSISAACGQLRRRETKAGSG